MARRDETAYPYLKRTPSEHELREVFTPSSSEVDLAREVAPRSDSARLGFLVLLKTYQWLGYFVSVREVPAAITEHIARSLGYLLVPAEPGKYDTSGTRLRHMNIIRERQGLKAFDAQAERLLAQSVRAAAQTREDLRDIINYAVEDLSRRRYELCGFTVMRRQARAGRAEVNGQLCQAVLKALGEQGCKALDCLWSEAGTEAGTTLWNDVKRDPGRPTLPEIRAFTRHERWLHDFKPSASIAGLLSEAKLRQFAAEASQLDAGSIRRLTPARRYTLAAAFLEVKASEAIDDLGTLLVRRMAKVHEGGREALQRYKEQQQERTARLVRTLRDVAVAYSSEGEKLDRFAAVEGVLGDEAGALIAQCDEYEAGIKNNYFPFVWAKYKDARSALFAILRHVPFESTSSDKGLERARQFLLDHEHRRGDWLARPAEGLDLSWVPDGWWPLIMTKAQPDKLNRKHFEACVFSQLMLELRNGDTCIPGSLEFGDYRQQLVSDEEYAALSGEFCEEVGLPLDPAAFVAHVRTELAEQASQTDHTFPANGDFMIRNGEPSLKRIKRTPDPPGLRQVEQALKTGLNAVGVLDALVMSESLLRWTKFFGLISGFESRLKDARARYVVTTFCYGCNLGPSQTARSLEGLDRKQIALVNARHVTEDMLDAAIVHVVNAYQKFELPGLWGDGKSVSADGKKFDVYEQNLLAEYHVRYGGYGGLGYYHVSDKYIALFSRFIPCGVWEAIYILDGLVENESEVESEVVYADTQGQSVAVFALAYLLGIDLLPRIRHWKGLIFLRPEQGAKFEHIDDLFSQTIDWELIKRHWPDMLRVALSVKRGRIRASAILKRLGTYSRKNKLYFAFRELGRALRTRFLLRYLNDGKLRANIQAAMNKSEQFFAFLDWVGFGGDVINTNDRDEQRKRTKYLHLMANCLIFYTVLDLTRVVRELRERGEEVPEECLARINPYQTEHINRLGEYQLNLEQEAPEPMYEFRSARRPN